MSGRLLLQLRMRAPWRRVLGNRSVFREVQGVGLWMPWSHRLPDYAAIAPGYGQNLVELAALLTTDANASLQMVDVGANIGDSSLQIRARVNTQVLAVEADPYYLEYLRRNLGTSPEVTIAPLLLTTAGDRDQAWSPSRSGGTTHFRRHATPAAAPERARAYGSLPAALLPAKYLEFDNVRLIKSDTDGYDSQLIPELAEAYRASRPVLFFEYDPTLTNSVSGAQADRMWPLLAALGYDRVAFWSNAGAPLETASVGTAAECAPRLLQDLGPNGYLDAAVVHAEDLIAQEALKILFDVPNPGD